MVSGFCIECRLVQPLPTPDAEAATRTPNAADWWRLSRYADDDLPTHLLLPFMMEALGEAEDAVEEAGGGMVEGYMRARVLAHNFGELGTLLGRSGDGGYWMGRVALLQREAELVEQAGQRGGDWHDAFYHRMAVVEERIEEAERRWTEHAGQMRMDLARRWAPAEEEAAMELEARAVEVEARAAEERVAATAARDGLVAAMAIAEWREMGMEEMEERAVELEARAMEVETRAVERAARVEARARSHAEMEMEAAWRDREEVF